MSKANYSCTFNLDDCIKTLGLEAKGRVQRKVDEEFLKLAEPYVPQYTGALIGSGITNTVVGSGEIVYDIDDKARRLYYHPEYNFREKGESENGGLGRGGYWADRCMQNGGLEAIEQVARNEVKK